MTGTMVKVPYNLIFFLKNVKQSLIAVSSELSHYIGRRYENYI